MDGHLSFETDLAAGFVTVSGSGMWSAARAEAHFRELEHTILKIRREHGSVRALIDLREASVQTTETAAIMREWTTRIYRVADRVAVVCATALLALQIKRAANVETLATFHEIEPAMTWIGPAKKRA